MSEVEKLNSSNTLSLPPMVLASGSPRRKALIESLGFSFRVDVPKVQELQEAESPEALVLENARLKGAEVLKRSASTPDRLVIAADTIVCLGKKVLGKPANAEEVVSHLEELSGRSHEVITGIALLRADKPEEVKTTTTVVSFRNLEEAEIQAYARMKEPYDKAGSYAIQGLGSLFIDSISGSYTNVVGFPIETFLRLLERVTDSSAFNWFEKK